MPIQKQSTVETNTAVETNTNLEYPSPLPQCDGPADCSAVARSSEVACQTDQGGNADVNNSDKCIGDGSLVNEESFQPLAADSPVEYKITCFECRKELVDRCMRCFLCGNVFLCTSCFYRKGHKEHFCFLTNFDPSTKPHVPHCMSCFLPIPSMTLTSVLTCTHCKFIQGK